MRKNFKTRNISLKLAAIIWILFCVWVTPAHAYLDPGTGSMILQAILGLLFGIGLTLSRFRIKARSILQRLKKKITGTKGGV